MPSAEARTAEQQAGADSQQRSSRADCQAALPFKALRGEGAGRTVG